MAAGNEDIRFGNFMPRLLKVVTRPGVLRTMLAAMRARGNTPGSVCDFLEDNARQRPDHPALLYQDRSWTWAEVNAWANRYAHYFASRGVGRGDAVAINLANRVETLITVWGVQKLGAVAAMLNTSQTGHVLSHSIGLVKPRLIVIGEEALDNMTTVAQLLESEYAGRLLYLADDSEAPPPAGYEDLAALSADQPGDNLAVTRTLTLGLAAFYIFTSGTTGMPKASIMSHLRAWRAGMFMGRGVMDMQPDDVMYCSLPYYHNNAVMLTTGCVLAGGATMAIGRKFSVSSFWDEIRRYQATSFCYIGELLRYLLNQPPRENDRDHQVYKIIGNGLRPDVWDAFKERFGIERIHEFYGSSEGNGGSINALNYDKTCGFQPGVNKDWAIVEYDVDADEPVRDAKGRMRALGVGETGLMIYNVSEKYPFEGYTDPAAGEKKLLRDVFRKGDCWFNSGDLLKRLPMAHLQFVDRVGDTFRWQGENVATTEVEAAVIRWPHTADAVVYGVQVPNRDGRCGMLAWTPARRETADLAALAEHLQRELPKYAVPRFLRLEESAEVTGTFKHQKSKLKEQGYDPSRVDGELYVLRPGAESFEPLDTQLKARIDAGEIRL